MRGGGIARLWEKIDVEGQRPPRWHLGLLVSVPLTAVDVLTLFRTA